MQLCSDPTKCTAALPWAKGSLRCSVLLCKSCTRQIAYTYRDLLLMQLCSDPTPMHCSTALGTMHSSLLHAALQKVLGAGLCHCNHTYRDMLSMQLFSDPTPMHSSTALGKTQSPLLSAALRKRLTAGLWQDALRTAQCCSTQIARGRACAIAITPIEICSSCTAALPWSKMRCSLLSAALQKLLEAGLCIHLSRFAPHAAVQ